MSDLTFYVCDLVTGLILTELPLVADTIKVQAATEDQQGFTLNPADPLCPDDWADLLTAGKTMTVLTIDDQPAAGWWIIDHTIGATSIPITGYTLEHCAARANVPTVNTTGPVDYSQLAALVAAPLVTRYGFTIEHTDTGNTRDDLYYDNTVDRSILAALQEDFLRADDGPEWRIIVRWNSSHNGFDKVLQIQPKIGIDRPDAIFDLDADGRGNIDTYTRQTSYALGKGATMLIGVSDGSGASRPMTDPPVVSTLVADNGWPEVEERVSFTGLDSGTVQDEDATLLAHTKALLVQRRLGTTTWQVTGTADAPVPGRDYAEGDTVHIDVAPQGKLDPVGGTAAMRTLGWQLDLTSRRGTLIAWPDDDGTSSSGSV